MKCVKCGANYGSELVKCPYCGEINASAVQYSNVLQGYNEEYKRVEEALTEKGSSKALKVITICMICIYIFVLAITFFVKRKNIGLSTLIVVLLNQYPVDFVTGLITHSDSLVINVLWILAGIIFVAIGCDILIASNLGMGIYDAFVFGIADRLNKKFVIVRYVIDSIFLILTIILHGYIGIGTILPYILTGPIIAYTKPIIEKMIKFD